MSNRLTYFLAGILLVAVFLLAFFSIKDDSLTMDELAHLPAGYSYLTQQDMRLNPEHPPLVKDLAALPLLFIENIKFPSEISAWQKDVNGQWDFGRYFLYQTGNPAEQMIFWSKIPMILLLILLGFYIFKWAKELFGKKTALLALFFFSFSPTFLAHGRLVTTDLGAALGVVLATYYFIKALKSPGVKNIVIAGLVFGVAELLKFSLILLVPLFGLMGLVWWLTKSGTFLQTFKTGLLVFLIGIILIWPVYQYHTWNYPAERQLQDSQIYLKDTVEPIKSVVLWMSDKPFVRAYAQYFTGLSMIFQRVAGGNTTYFLGEVSNLGWRSYFPIVYAIKEPLAFHIFTLIALLYAFCLVRRSFSGGGAIKKRVSGWLRAHFPEFSMLIFIALYWLVSIFGNLNI